ncbi:MAG: hypothetical protein K0R02_1195 [Rickettsiaceae bacterium]|jgi:hypothetical protein|nr:hypothetical protein [Rickettsiaceae bacterium]
MTKDINQLIKDFKRTNLTDFRIAKEIWHDLDKMIESLEKYYPSTLKQIWGDSIFNKGIFHKDMLVLMTHCNKIIEQIKRRKESSELNLRNYDEWSSLKETIQAKIDMLNNIFNAFSFSVTDTIPQAEVVFSTNMTIDKLHDGSLTQTHLKFAALKGK